jgi:hypothetical protein
VRTWEATGRVDARLVTAIREALDAETHTSTGTRQDVVGSWTAPLPLTVARSTGEQVLESREPGLQDVAGSG